MKRKEDYFPAQKPLSNLNASSVRNFKQLRIWQKGFEIALSCYNTTNQFPKTERFGLISQINRASISISSNIAEGCSRSSEKDYARFIEISLGSAFELETQLIIARNLKFGNPELVEKLIFEVGEVQKMLTGFHQKLKRGVATNSNRVQR